MGNYEVYQNLVDVRVNYNNKTEKIIQLPMATVNIRKLLAKKLHKPPSKITVYEPIPNHPNSIRCCPEKVQIYPNMYLHVESHKYAKYGSRKNRGNGGSSSMAGHEIPIILGAMLMN